MRRTINALTLPWLWLSLLALFYPAQVYASDAAARVIAASGVVTALGDNGPRELVRRSAVYVGESVFTGPGAKTQLRFSDGAIVSIEPESEVLIEAYDYNTAEPTQSRALLRMITGGLRSITGAIADDYPEGYQVSTPLASIGVRGTDFQLSLSSQKLVVGVWDGVVIVQNDNGAVNIGPKLPFRFAVVQPGQSPERLLDVPKELLTSRATSSDDRSETGQPSADQTGSTTDGAMDAADSGTLDQSLPAQRSTEVTSANNEPPVAEDPAAPAPELGPDLPAWFAPKQDRHSATLFIRPGIVDSGITQFTANTGRSAAPADGDGITISTQDFETQDYGFIVQDWPASAANKAANFPVYWGRWNGTSEVLNFFSNSPNADGSYDLATYDVYAASEAFEGASWAYSEVAALALTDIQDLLPASSILSFHSGAGFDSGLVMESRFSDGALDPSRSFISFDLDLNAGQVVENSRIFELVVIGDGFDQVWTSTKGAIDNGSNLSGEFPQLKFSYINSTMSTSDGSITVTGPTGSFVEGFMIPSDIDPSQIGFVGSLSVSARDSEFNLLSNGYVLFLLEGQ